jgi:hypothetical protein
VRLHAGAPGGWRVPGWLPVGGRCGGQVMTAASVIALGRPPAVRGSAKAEAASLIADRVAARKAPVSPSGRAPSPSLRAGTVGQV